MERGRCPNSEPGRTVGRLQQRLKSTGCRGVCGHLGEPILNTQGQLKAQCHMEGYYGIEKLSSFI